MAGAKPGVHVVQLKPISVPEPLTRGSKFIMWNDVSTNFTLSVSGLAPAHYVQQTQ